MTWWWKSRTTAPASRPTCSRGSSDLNLIVNAIDAMKDGGTLKLITCQDPYDVVVEVQDNGAGIAPDVQSRIFRSQPDRERDRRDEGRRHAEVDHMPGSL